MIMPFDPNSANKSDKESKRGAVKKDKPFIKEKMEMLYEKVLDNLIKNQEKLTNSYNYLYYQLEYAAIFLILLFHMDLKHAKFDRNFLFKRLRTVVSINL